MTREQIQAIRSRLEIAANRASEACRLMEQAEEAVEGMIDDRHAKSEADAHEARVTELLASNNALLERARSAESRLREGLALMRRATRVMFAGCVKDDLERYLSKAEW